MSFFPVALDDDVFKMYAGDSFDRFIRINEDGVPKVLTGFTPKAEMRQAPQDTTPIATYTCTLSDQTLNPGGVLITLTHTQSEAIPPGTYNMDFQLTDGAGLVQTYFWAKVIVAAQYTKGV